MRHGAALLELIHHPRSSALLLCAFVSSLATVASAQAPPGAAAPPEPAVAASAPLAAARRHFKSGVKLYQDTNYAGALAEFEAAYALKPGASSLQNVALCHKALFRYGEAADTLRLLLERHSDELGADEQRAVSVAIEELEGLVGSLVIKVHPAHARVALDGHVVPPEQRQRRLRTNVGEHTVVAEAPGYSRAARTLRLAGGQHDVLVELSLEPVMGFLDVTADDPLAVIAVDQQPVARHRWSGPVTPGEEHLVQVYRAGYESFEQVVQVGVGKSVSVRAALERSADDGGGPTEDAESNSSLPPAPSTGALGWYGLATLSLLGTGGTPLAFDITNTRASTEAGALGLRAGYRFWRAVAGEVLLDFGNLTVKNACDTTQGTCGGDDQVDRDYRMTWARFGPNLRFMTAGEQVRFVSGAGVGAVYHRLKLDEHRDLGLAGEDAAGVDPYFLLELGIGLNLGHWLVEADALAMIDGTERLRSKLASKVQSERGTMPLVGLSLRFGWSQWKPK